MDYSKMSPYELGNTNNKQSIPYIIRYLKDGQDSEKRLAASAVYKLAKSYPADYATAYQYLIQNLDSEKPQVRQYTLKAILSLSKNELDVSEHDVSIIKHIVFHDEKEYNRSIALKIVEKWGHIDTETINTEEAERIHFPEGATRKVIEKAKLASTKTTVELVDDREADAFYFRSLEAKGIKLNQPQLQATRHDQGPALVLAGAGSGKTRVLTSRAGHLISVRQINPKKILLLTFTKKAAEEMKARIAMLPGLTPKIVRDLTSGTYHSIFLRLLRGQGDQRKIISNEKHKHVYLKMIMKEMGLMDDYEPESLLAILSQYKNNMISVEEIPARSPIEKEVKEILTRYEKKKQANGLMDFDDILLDAYLLLKRNEYILNKLQNQFTFILCDEWQDTNPVQFELIKMLSRPQNNLFVVGDDDQTIYEFNGADSSIMLCRHHKS